MHLPGLDNPHRYVGLFVYDFKTHVAVGYTSQEVRYLRESKEHQDGTAYEIYRANDQGGLELRGAMDERLTSKEAMCFLREDGDAARHDYDQIRKLSERHPLPARVELQLIKHDEFELEHMAVLIYDATSTNAISSWLGSVDFAGGDQVLGGIDVYAKLVAVEGLRVDTCNLPSLLNYTDRTKEQVLDSVSLAVQR